MGMPRPVKNKNNNIRTTVALAAGLILAYLFAVWLYMAAEKPCADNVGFMRALLHPEERCSWTNSLF